MDKIYVKHIHNNSHWNAGNRMPKLKRRFLTKLLYWCFGVATVCLIFLNNDKHCQTEVRVTMEDTNLIHDYDLTINERRRHKSFQDFAYARLSANIDKSFIKQEKEIALSSLKNLGNEWISCNEIHEILERAQKEKSVQHRKDNADGGNKAVYFTSILNPTGQRTRVVVKHATLKNASSEGQLYRYHSAQKEIDNLRKLKSLGWKGIPELLGACSLSQNITYVVSQIIGKPFCSGTGTSLSCAMALEIKSFIQESPDRRFSALLWLSKVLCFFKQFEEHRVFMEDFSGINFYFSPETLDLFIVDADSLLFYGDTRIYSRSSCRESFDCVRPSGNLWRSNALNYKIYFNCSELKGYCFKNTCRGYDSSLHTCGIGKWLVLPLRFFIPEQLIEEYKRIRNCMMEYFPQDRCSISQSCDAANEMLTKFQKLKKAQNLLNILV